MSLLHADKNAQNGGYLIGTGVFMAIFIAVVIVQIAMKRFNPFVYWLTIVATTTVGTTMADFADRSLGIGYAGGSSLLLALLLGCRSLLLCGGFFLTLESKIFIEAVDRVLLGHGVE